MVNWNGVRHLADCLPSLAAQSYPNVEVLVIDNGSTEDSREVTENYGARWVRLETNVALAQALNLGVQAAFGEIVLLLNNDMRFDRDFIKLMVHELVRDPTIFAVDAKQLDWEGTRTVHQATFIARRRPRDADTADEIVPGLFLTQHASDGPRDVVMASGANLMVRREMFESLGGLDERMQMGLEDVDLCWRAWLNGWRTVFVPAAVCWHRGGASSVTAEGRRSRFDGTLTGRLVFATKLLPWSFALRVWANSLAGLAHDVALPRRAEPFVQWRLEVLNRARSYLLDLVEERRRLHRRAGATPREHLQSMLRLDSA